MAPAPPVTSPDWRRCATTSSESPTRRRTRLACTWTRSIGQPRARSHPSRTRPSAARAGRLARLATWRALTSLRLASSPPSRSSSSSRATLRKTRAATAVCRRMPSPTSFRRAALSPRRTTRTPPVVAARARASCRLIGSRRLPARSPNGLRSQTALRERPTSDRRYSPRARSRLGSMPPRCRTMSLESTSHVRATPNPLTTLSSLWVSARTPPTRRSRTTGRLRTRGASRGARTATIASWPACPLADLPPMRSTPSTKFGSSCEGRAGEHLDSSNFGCPSRVDRRETRVYDGKRRCADTDAEL
mmetsp:Transcript_27698/g.62672  ORF Transcript_27698/g.62672 Transcript_27698/m.62672 type:complete len:304 (-) Transcript_27698:260-1171(-)